MQKGEEKINAWLQNHLIPRLAAALGERCDSRVECKVTRPSGSFFLSQIHFVSIRFPSGERSFVIKLPSEDPIISGQQSYDNFFANEMLFYETLAIEEQNSYAKLHLGGEDPVFGYLMVLEDLRPRGFGTSPIKLNTELDYLLAAMQCFARLHGQTYMLKEKVPKKLQAILGKIRECKYRMNDNARVTYMNSRMLVIVQILRERNYDAVFIDKMEELFQDCFNKVIINCTKPTEPLATIVHGDATINNILFKKESESLKAVLIDFAQIFYSSPAIDISLLLFLSASRKDMNENFGQLFKAYHDSLKTYLKNHDCWDPVKYSYDAFLKDYKEYGIFGYIITVFFLPIMVEYERNNELVAMPHKLMEISKIGGDEYLMNSLADMLIDMRKCGLLDSFVDSVDPAHIGGVCER